MADEILGHTIEEWMPMPPPQGPPLPEFLHIYWPWYKEVAPPPVVYTCPYCGATFATEAEKNYHIQTQHAAPPIYTCPYCGATFSTQADLNAHIQTQHPAPPPGAADIRLENLVIQYPSIVVGATNYITVTATNYGSAAGSKKVTCQIDSASAEQTVTLNPGESTQVTFATGATEAKTYQVKVDGLSGSFTATAPPSGLAVLSGQITDSDTKAPLASAKVQLYGPSIAIVSSDSTGHYQTPNLTPGQYAITVSLAGYQTRSWNIMVTEGSNPLDIVLYPAPPAAGVTIDKFEMRCGFTEGDYGVLHTRITITNHTGQTFIDHTPTGPTGGLVVQMGAEGWKWPATENIPGYLGNIFRLREWDALGIGDLPPGTHTYECVLAVMGSHAGPDTNWWVIPWNWFDTYEIVEGTRGYAQVQFRAGDETTVPGTVFAQAVKNFEGVFSAQWQTWQPTSWTPPPFPEIPPITPPSF
jgi:uncharacterized C2H2 Zn-finger protein